MNRVLEAWKAVGQDSLNLPNVITLVRILLIPVFVMLFFTPTPERSLSAAVVFVVAAVTDLLDGYIARRTGQITKLGKLLDPIADKLLVLSALILLVNVDRVRRRDEDSTKRTHPAYSFPNSEEPGWESKNGSEDRNDICA